jgi:hypothetical protein
MRRLTWLCIAVLLAGGAAFAQDQKSPRRPVKKGDALTVKGCLAGGALEATESDGLEGTGLLQEGITFRLTGDKALLKQLREKYDRRLVSIAGVLKSDLPQLGGQTRSVGRVRITIGGASPSPHSPQTENRRALPVLQVTSFDGSETACAR